MEFFNLLDAGEKKKFEIKEVGNGIKSGHQSFHISDDIDLATLKKKTKDYGVTINDLFTGACVSAFSKLDRT